MALNWGSMVAREFDSRPPQLILDGWPSWGGPTTSVFHRATQANSASVPQWDVEKHSPSNNRTTQQTKLKTILRTPYNIHKNFLHKITFTMHKHEKNSSLKRILNLKTIKLLFQWKPHKKWRQTRMWANAQPDGRPAEHRWRPLFNAAKFGWRPLLDAVQ